MSGFFTTKHNAYPDPIDPDLIEYTGRVHSVSFSVLNKFEKCPYSVFLSRAKGIKAVGSDAMDRGSLLHKILEDYVSGTRNKVPWTKFKSNKHYAPIIDSFREAHSSKNRESKCEVELKLCFDKEMKQTKWTDKNTWLRAMIDVVMFKAKGKHAVIYDYKTGSNQSAAKDRAQLMLYALLMFIKYPKLETLEATAIYLDLTLDNFYTSYTRHDLKLYWPRYLKRLQKVTDCETFRPNPNAFTCRYCQHKEIQTSLAQTTPACGVAYNK